MGWLQNLLDSSSLPILSAFLLGILTSISPCPLATNITAIAFISKDIENKKRVFINGLIYTLGRAITYTTIGIVFFLGASQFKVAGFLQRYGERVIGPILILVGVFMLDLIRVKFTFWDKISDRIGNREEKESSWGVLLMGIGFALAFCPYSGVLYFGMLIPITISSVSGLYLPLIFAIGTGLPVILIAYLIAYTVSGVVDFYNKIKVFEFWFRRVIAIVFIGAGVYYIFQFIS
jgi:cytochrome c-type biogenesis protein